MFSVWRWGTVAVAASHTDHIWIRYAPDDAWTHRLLRVNDVAEPLICDHVFLHAAHHAIYESRVDQIFSRRQLEWLPEKDCHISYSSASNDRLRGTNQTSLGVMARQQSARFEAFSRLSSLARHGLLKTEKGHTPWLLYAEHDVVPLNRRRTIAHLVQKLQTGISNYANTTETRICSDYNACEVSAYPSRSLSSADKIALVLTPDPECHRNSHLASGVMLGRPSRLLSFISEAYYLILRRRRSQSGPSPSSAVLQGLFHFSGEFLRHFCAYGGDEAWGPSTPSLEASEEGNEILMLRELDIHTAVSDRFLGPLAQKWFPEGKIPRDEPNSIAVVHPRWMNSWACYRSGMQNHQSPWFVHCGDMLAHFYGCQEGGYYSRFFRNLVTADARCNELLPFKRDDSDAITFDVNEWKRVRAH
eukprot:Protomagalhaensia_sp_Gyna_25__1493@NODE_1764_length_1553_cov_66_875826_g1446_i0_p1_GENE_NODE_1764_length_1553_cov_66_875826_g1446_i0NODE_1764_length_1553_cov_66_875826_g1446_i0_p1_ORF_typecomplete_len417_score17_68_NODE_1764_length_1553_cov_66_875826_g1446_i02711521